MREIKFRAFSKKANGMVFLEYAVYIVDDEIQPKNDYILMQYTGLKDKNGIEIYEGDIVRHIDSKHEVKFVGSIKHESGCFCVHNKFNNFDSWVFDYDYEVIGNIYENPELLKDE